MVCIHFVWNCYTIKLLVHYLDKSTHRQKMYLILFYYFFDQLQWNFAKWLQWLLDYYRGRTFREWLSKSFVSLSKRKMKDYLVEVTIFSIYGMFLLCFDPCLCRFFAFQTPMQTSIDLAPKLHQPPLIS